MNHIRMLAFILTSSILCHAHAQGTKAPASSSTGMKPGVWEISSVIQATDSPVRKTVTSRLCYTDADVGAALKVLPPQRGLGLQCDVSEVKGSDAAGLSWKLTCQGKDGAFTGTGSLKPSALSYSGQVMLEQKRAGKASKIDQAVTGRWVSTCA